MHRKTSPVAYGLTMLIISGMYRVHSLQLKLLGWMHNNWYDFLAFYAADVLILFLIATRRVKQFYYHVKLGVPQYLLTYYRLFCRGL